MAREGSSAVRPLSAVVMTTAVGVLGLVVFLLGLEVQRQTSVKPLPDTGARFSPDWKETFPSRADALTRRLEELPWKLSEPTLERQEIGGLQFERRHYELSLPQEEEGKVVQALRMAAEEPGVEVDVERTESGLEARFGLEGLETHSLSVHWKRPASEGPPRVAIVLEGLGDNLLSAREVLRFDFPVAVAVDPSLPFAREVALLARHYRREVLLHLAGDSASPEGSEAAVFSAALRRGLESVPNLVGVNHGESERTPGSQEVALLAEELVRNRLFVVDRTLPEDVRERLRAAGVSLLSVDLVLDRPPRASVVQENLSELLRLAERRGTALALGRPYRVTVDALRRFGRWARQEGVEIVPLSSFLVRPEAWQHSAR
ncbi:MAG: hypothetical protein KatS3mg076_1872 [Candidatus Binatia bacterium]|nr:MAG: hypothetical protein KatS3mg076_1872 [Candidatus Binatia bacterium]